VTPLLQRIKNTKTQKDLTRAERFTNIARSFTLADGQAITNKNIILIDDVITTGATLLEAVKVLKSAGASQVWCLTLARD
jgi:competence protein ComFC